MHAQLVPAPLQVSSARDRCAAVAHAEARELGASSARVLRRCESSVAPSAGPVPACGNGVGESCARCQSCDGGAHLFGLRRAFPAARRVASERTPQSSRRRRRRRRRIASLQRLAQRSARSDVVCSSGARVKRNAASACVVYSRRNARAFVRVRARALRLLRQ